MIEAVTGASLINSNGPLLQRERVARRDEADCRVLTTCCFVLHFKHPFQWTTEALLSCARARLSSLVFAES